MEYHKSPPMNSALAGPRCDDGEVRVRTTGPDVTRSLFILLNAMDGLSKRVQSMYGISGPQLSALWALREHHELGTSALARIMCLHPSTVTGIIDRLQAKGLVTRHRDVPDHRRVRLAITPAGLERIEDAPRPIRARIAELLNALPPAESDTLAKTFEALVEAVGEEVRSVGRPPAGALKSGKTTYG